MLKLRRFDTGRSMARSNESIAWAVSVRRGKIDRSDRAKDNVSHAKLVVRNWAAGIPGDCSIFDGVSCPDNSLAVSRALIYRGNRPTDRPPRLSKPVGCVCRNAPAMRLAEQSRQTSSPSNGEILRARAGRSRTAPSKIYSVVRTARFAGNAHDASSSRRFPIYILNCSISPRRDA